MCARPFTPNHPLSLGRGKPKSGDLVAAANIGTVAGPFTRAGTVINDRVGDKRIGAGRATNLSVTLLHSGSVGQDGANLLSVSPVFTMARLVRFSEFCWRPNIQALLVEA